MITIYDTVYERDFRIGDLFKTYEDEYKDSEWEEFSCFAEYVSVVLEDTIRCQNDCEIRNVTRDELNRMWNKIDKIIEKRGN